MGVESAPFKKWMDTLRRRGTDGPSSTPVLHRRQHRKSDSVASSIGFITDVKAASVSLAGTSIAQPSSLGTASSGQMALADESARHRSRKRREKIEELVRTEENYVADLRALNNAYSTLLSPHAPTAAYSRPSAQSNVAQILQLHDDLLGKLHAAIPFSEYDQTVAQASRIPTGPGHIRWHSTESAPFRIRMSLPARYHRRSLNIERSSAEQEPMVLACTPQTTANVARIFTATIQRFRLYEEYAARCETMQQEIDEMQRDIPGWPDYDKAMETLSASLHPANSRDGNLKKALTVKDLLIKPIQRITRYELLFKDLCKLTPSCDDPESHASLEALIALLADACRSVNESKDNPERLRLLEICGTLQSRLVFPEQIFRPSTFDAMGRLSLCGVLHVAYRSKSGMKGQYLILTLYQSCLLLSNFENLTKYRVLLVILLSTATIEEADNGKGLQCHTAPHSWKLVFENGGKMYEMLLTACSAVEDSIWRTKLSQHISIETQQAANITYQMSDWESPIQFSLIRDMRSIGKAFGKAGGFVRRLSVHRSATLGPTTDLNQVIIKNTQAIKDALDNSSTSSLPIPRSQSVMTPSHVPTLAPRRAERIRLESVMADVWTKDAIPYPGMERLRRRPENTIRASANSVIRKLSMASLASNFSISKRSLSYTGIAGLTRHDNPSGGSLPSSTTEVQPTKASGKMSNSMSSRSGAEVRLQKSTPAATAAASSKPARRKPLIDFHNAPEAFLPEDFELKKGKGSGVRTSTLATGAAERARSPFWERGIGFGTLENKPSGTDLKRRKTKLLKLFH